MEAASDTVTLDDHATAARRDPGNGMAAFVSALRDDAELMTEAQARLETYKKMGRRMEACWVSRTTETTLLAALEAANAKPEVPAGDTNV